jgi:hypothetical protein
MEIGARVVNFATSKISVVKNKYRLNLPIFLFMGRHTHTHAETHHVLTDNRWHSNRPTLMSESSFLWKRPLGRPRLKLENNIKMDLNKLSASLFNGCNWLRIWFSGGLL